MIVEGLVHLGQSQPVRSGLEELYKLIGDGVSDIPIEQRSGAEVSQITGRTADGAIETVTVTPPDCPVANYAFDVTPARLVTALITERGVCAASRDGLAALYNK